MQVVLYVCLKEMHHGESLRPFNDLDASREGTLKVREMTLDKR
jgi:hypothetical protein